MGSKIPAFSTLVFDVELLEIKVGSLVSLEAWPAVCRADHVLTSLQNRKPPVAQAGIPSKASSGNFNAEKLVEVCTVVA